MDLGEVNYINTELCPQQNRDVWLNFNPRWRMDFLTPALLSLKYVKATFYEHYDHKSLKLLYPLTININLPLNMSLIYELTASNFPNFIL
jgi:hypothetical protein